MNDEARPQLIFIPVTQENKDALSEAAFGITKAEAHKAGICVECKQIATWRTDAGRREYQISGLCEPCFDAMFGEE